MWVHTDCALLNNLGEYMWVSTLLHVHTPKQELIDLPQTWSPLFIIETQATIDADARENKWKIDFS